MKICECPLQKRRNEFPQIVNIFTESCISRALRAFSVAICLQNVIRQNVHIYTQNRRIPIEHGEKGPINESNGIRLEKCEDREYF